MTVRLMLMDVGELAGLLGEFAGAEYGELRYHERLANAVAVRKGELETASSGSYSGVGVRALVGGKWGFSATSRPAREELKAAIHAAVQMAKAQQGGAGRTAKLAPVKLAIGTYKTEINDPFSNHPIEERLELVKAADLRARKSSPLVRSASCRFSELADTKIICTTDGARAVIEDAKSVFAVFVVAAEGTNISEGYEACGASGGWKDLFRRRGPEEIVDLVTGRAIRLLKADFPRGEQATVILDPSIVGLIAHEAIGHTVEADLVMAGAATKGKIGTRVASDLVTLADSGPSVHEQGAGGVVLVDDEGVVTGRTAVIENGILKSYLHNRESAEIFGVAPTGNARAFEYSSEPIIRMRNTYIEPGHAKME
ncbi:MAG: TldD/PmbA family protein, partial [Planctomycetota bacterium]|nr:TldD/PmbA family protein [Planctomycetota bacterium]